MKKFLLIICLMIALPVFAEIKVLAFAGSVRKDSYNKKLLGDAASIARQMGAKVTVIDLKDYPMPFYDADLEASQGLPKNADRLRELMINSDAIIIASPEYNASISAVLKNTLDWASRDKKGGYSPQAFKGKKFAIMSASPGPGGGHRGLTHLRTILEALGGTVVKPEVSISSAHEYFGVDKRPSNPALQEEIKQLLAK